MRLLDSEFKRAQIAGASIVHAHVTVAGRSAERYRVTYSKGPSSFFDAEDVRFLRPCQSCEAEYVVIPWPGPSHDIPLRIDAVARPGTKLADHQANIDAIVASLKAEGDDQSATRGYVAMGPVDKALNTLISYMEARIEGQGAERLLDEAALRAYGRHLTLYWFTNESMVPSYQVVARVPLNASTTRFEVILEENCRAPNECTGRSAIEFLEVHAQDQSGLIVKVPECRQSATALRACLFATS
ncbi:MAG: hypothetical protein ACRDJ1_00645 [Actinomycetota bacterium]